MQLLNSWVNARFKYLFQGLMSVIIFDCKRKIHSFFIPFVNTAAAQIDTVGELSVYAKTVFPGIGICLSGQDAL